MRKSIPMDSFINKVGRANPPLTHRNEFPAEYSLASCSPAELASAFPAELILLPNPPFGQKFSSNGYCRINSLSHRRAQSKASTFNRAQQVSIREQESLARQAVENKLLLQLPDDRLGRIGSTVDTLCSFPHRFNNLENWGVGPC